ncbi:MAG TPA: dephospho-CoA kinase [Flavisolibacter sp.]|jgi:dephospho-CoA kinase|nr:dephospho-CoA kinase [Flavisolibacter sp.]HZH99606.1 dephospho-CoA kinase [Flavisolibacter sp.]
MIFKVGLTGGIGSGKTTVAKVFELLGVPVYYADEASKRLYHTEPKLMKEMKTLFGEQIYTNNILNRKLLAEIVFQQPEKLTLLNDLVHPLTLKDASIWMQNQVAPYVIKEAALLFEAGSAEGLHYIIGVTAPQHLRLKRVMDRDGISREDVLRRMDRQIDDAIKMRLCDVVVHNNEQELLIPQIISLHQQLLEKAKQLL